MSGDPSLSFGEVSKLVGITVCTSHAHCLNTHVSWLQKKGVPKASGYICFSTDVRKEVMNKYKEMTFGEISRLVGQMVGAGCLTPWRMSLEPRCW